MHGPHIDDIQMVKTWTRIFEKINFKAIDRREIIGISEHCPVPFQTLEFFSDKIKNGTLELVSGERMPWLFEQYSGRRIIPKIKQAFLQFKMQAVSWLISNHIIDPKTDPLLSCTSEPEVAQIFLDRGSSIEPHPDRPNTSPLLFALGQNANWGMCYFLLDKGARVENAPDRNALVSLMRGRQYQEDCRSDIFLICCMLIVRGSELVCEVEVEEWDGDQNTTERRELREALNLGDKEWGVMGVFLEWCVDRRKREE
eukprot:TRINITY_DN1065_c0_g3_i1.p1 TRINITY_DN1065_c0_g3~~TRINITY_DN1065_c0_g3_i1.p1  ORF type:complete len:256 (+),score=52.86 TRINITY_DN1065_c0_g3_i1:703-1470(+)